MTCIVNVEPPDTIASYTGKGVLSDEPYPVVTRHPASSTTSEDNIGLTRIRGRGCCNAEVGYRSGVSPVKIAFTTHDRFLFCDHFSNNHKALVCSTAP